MAAADTSPATFRVSREERYILESVAHYQDQTLSAFVREAALDLAHDILNEAGVDAVLAGDSEYAQRSRVLGAQEAREALHRHRAR